MESHEHFYHHLQLIRNGRAEFTEMFASSAIRSFARSIISLFVPLYLLNLEYSLGTVFLFLALENGFHAIFVIPAMRCIAWVGIKHAILWSKFFEILQYFLLFLLVSGNLPLLLLVAVVGGFQRALFFTAYHLDMLKIIRKEKRGTEIGLLHFVSAVFTLIGPVFGGVMLATVGFGWVFAMTAFLLLVSTVPLFFTPDVRVPYVVRVRDIFARGWIRDGLAYVGYGIESGAAGTVWSIFLFLNIVSSFTVLGFVATIANAVSLAANLIVGKLSDRYRRFTLRMGSLLSSGIAVVQIFTTAISHVFAINMARGVSHKLLYITADAITYERAADRGAVPYILFREIIINGARSIFYVGMIFASSLIVGFIAGALASLLFLFF